MNSTAVVPTGDDTSRSVSSAVNCERFGRRVSSSWVAAHRSCSAARRCSVMSCTWAIASISPLSSNTETEVCAHTTEPSSRR
jgi:hypothetical protein